ncbi:S8 family serine peptidase [Streptomyces sp. NPDC057271]|uniref:S8 family peptidase n=1 Tax=unclassified Streptomyces TaxID=2593676 RepID=UPI003639C61C
MNSSTTPRRASARLTRGSAALVCAGLLTTGLVAAAPSTQDAGDFRPASAATAVPDSYIVIMKNGTSIKGLEGKTAKLAKKYHGRAGKVFKGSLVGFSARMSEANARRLAAEPGVDRVVQDEYGHTADVQPSAPAHLDRIDERVYPLDGKYNGDSTNIGRGRTIYVVDTGLRTTHEIFGGRASVAFDATLPEGSAGYGMDCHGHGTFVAGLAAGDTHGVARGAAVKAVRIGQCDGRATGADTVEAVNWITENGDPRAIVNFSYGFNIGAVGDLIEEAVNRSVGAGFTWVVAAGNDNKDACTKAVSRLKSTITVAATAAGSDTRANYSNYGSCVNLYAPGSATSASNGSDTAVTSGGGTSYATPLVAGQVAELGRQRGSLSTPSLLRTALLSEATPNAITSEPSANAARMLHTGGHYVRYTPVSIPDGGTAFSQLSVSDQADPGTAMGTYLRVSASIQHPSRGQLQVDLFAPNGKSWRLYSPNTSTGADLTLANVPLVATDVPPNGTWSLRVYDTATGSTGKILNFKLQF